MASRTAGHWQFDEFCHRQRRELRPTYYTEMYGPAAYRNENHCDGFGSRRYVSGLVIGSQAVALIGVRTHLGSH
jgi:hypothetical protein